MSTMHENTPTFADFTNRLKVYNDYIKALADYQKSVAELELKRAEAAAQWEKVRVMEAVLRQLLRDFENLRRVIAKNKAEIEKMQSREKLALVLLRGRPIATWSQSWSAMDWYLQRAILESTEDLYAIPLSEKAYDAANYINQRGKGEAAKAMPPTVTHVLGMVGWLRDEKMLPRLGSEAHRAFVQLVRIMNETVQDTIATMQKAMEEMRKGTFDAWRPPQLLGVSETGRRANVEFSARVPRFRSAGSSDKPSAKRRVP
jgi:hypothetical protein